MKHVSPTRRQALAPPAVTAILAVTVALAAATAIGASNTVTYKWVDEKGVVHYGDRVPPQYSKDERAILNTQGVEVRRLDAQKSPEQIATEERQRQEALKQKQHDSFLLTTYTSVKDIEALRDERLEQLKAQRTAAEAYVESLRSRLTALQTRALLFRPYNAKPGARRMPDDLAEDLVRTLNEMRSQSDALTLKSTEETSLKSQFQADIERYQQLHSLQERR